MYSRLQQICVLSLRRAVLSIGQVVVDHGVNQIAQLLLFSGAVKLRVDLTNTQNTRVAVHSIIHLIKPEEKIIYANNRILKRITHWSQFR